MLSEGPAVSLRDLGKSYFQYRHPLVKMLVQLFGLGARGSLVTEQSAALQSVNLEIQQGECLGLVGKNGAGKSTLLQLVAGIIEPTSGSVTVNGRVAALLELGAGFNPRFSGRENIFLNGLLLGFERDEIERNLASIIEFSELGQKIDHRVSTYSSGMFVRLAFSIATSVTPDILIIDEALSVGDGAFAKKSFDRIMQMKDAGTTIIFCSHATYHVDTICDRALWLDQGTVKGVGRTADVLDQYNQFLIEHDRPQDESEIDARIDPAVGGKLLSASVEVEGVALCVTEQLTRVKSGETSLTVMITGYVPDFQHHPNVGIVLNDATGHNVTSCGTHVDGFVIETVGGKFDLQCRLPEIPLLRGVYTLHVFLLCDKGIHIYDSRKVATLKVEQSDPSLGFFRIPHFWGQ